MCTRLSNGTDIAKKNSIIVVSCTEFASNSPPPNIISTIGFAIIIIPSIAGIVKKRILCMVFCMCSVYLTLLFVLAAFVRYGKTAVANAIPNRLTAKLCMFLAKLNAVNPPSIRLILTTANM